MIEVEELCCILEILNFVLVNHVVIGYIILMVSVRALVFLYSHGKPVKRVSALALSYAVRTSGQPELRV